MVLIYIFDVQKWEEEKNNKKGQFCENIRTKWTVFIRWKTGFIRRRTGFIRRAHEASPPADEASLPTDEASPTGPNIFFLFFSFVKYFLFVCTGSLTIRISVSIAFWLNYPFKNWREKNTTPIILLKIGCEQKCIHSPPCQLNLFDDNVETLTKHNKVYKWAIVFFVE